MKQFVPACLALALATSLFARQPAEPATQPATSQPAMQPAVQPAAAYPLDTCAVSGEAMTDNVMIDEIDGREVRFCCVTCATAFKSGGERAHEKLDQKIINATRAAYPLKACIVSGEPLGSMGEPILHVHRPTNQLVQLCCKSCVKQFEAKPEAYLPKLVAAAK